jgi:hypothetical protein
MAGAFGSVWIVDTIGRLLRVSPGDASPETVTVGTKALGRLTPVDVLGANGMLAIVARGPVVDGDFYSHVMSLPAKNARMHNDYPVMGDIVLGTDGTNLYVDGRHGTGQLAIHGNAGLGYWGFDVDTEQFPAVRDARRLAATSADLWVLDSRGAIQRVDRTTGKVGTARTVTAGRLDPATLDWTSLGASLWLLDDARGVLYEVR